MPAVAAELITEIRGKDVDASKLVDAYLAKLRAADAQAQRSGQSIGGALTVGQARAADAARKLSVAQAQVALTAQRAATEQQRTAGATAQAAAASSRAEAAALRLARAQTQVGTSSSLAAKFGEAATSSLLGIVGPAALASAGIGALIGVANSFKDAFEFKAELDATRASIDAQLRGVRDLGQTYSGAAAFAERFKLTQEETTQAIQASIGVMRSSRAPIEDILSVLARMQILSPEQSLQEAAVALKALASGDTTSLVTRFEVDRTLAAEMKNEIQGGADAVAVMNKFLLDSNVGMDALAARATGVSGAMKDVARATEQVKIAEATLAQGPGITALTIKAQALTGLARVLSGDLATGFEGAKNTMAGAIAQSDVYQAKLRETGSSVAAFIAAWNAMQAAGPPVTAVTDQAGQSALNAAVGYDTAAAATLAAANAAAAATPATFQLAGAYDAAVAAAQSYQAPGDAFNASLHVHAGEAALASAETQILSAQQQLLFDAAQAAALGMSVGSDAAGNLARMFGITTTEADQLIGRLRELAQLQNTLAFAKGAAAVGGGGGVGAFLANEAEEAHGKITNVFKGLTAGARKYNTDTNAIHRSGGAARLSDQQKLNNTLLADQERFQQQMEGAEREHGERLADIEAEFNRKSLEQQQANEVSKRQSRADFYDDLTQATKDVGPQIASELSAAYEQAYAEAQAMAQAGNAKLAADYLALKQEQIRAELDFQRAVAKAREDGDKAEVARLEAIHKLRQDAQQEEERQLLAGGDTNVQDRTDAMDEEQRRFDEQQGKIGTAAENAADRKVNAQLRSSKATDDENIKLQQQAALYDQIAARQGGGTGLPVGGAAVPGATTPAGALPADQGAVVGAINALQPLLDALRSAIESDTRETTSAIRSTASRAIQE